MLPKSLILFSLHLPSIKISMSPFWYLTYNRSCHMFYILLCLLPSFASTYVNFVMLFLLVIILLFLYEIPLVLIIVWKFYSHHQLSLFDCLFLVVFSENNFSYSFNKPTCIIPRTVYISISFFMFLYDFIPKEYINIYLWGSVIESLVSYMF